ncbi:major capsid protein [Rhodoplanes sp. TEM]|uniref:Major capsid protein n=1 Tax=Rhodoplanes tepidamans TaxID=200616 RepID=A0ABT5J5H5_RHOTP|nr:MULTISPECIES: major capsid protein [Rhodoplanes]MDC7784773.1 major capsid protein [Rhodoplanes tepidamans]MDC7982240.1 major capsid protein [Rhodoplanes sp. TEM]MDQ0356247.1 hypothetical protein [Rhodoplanes tepidamans]
MADMLDIFKGDAFSVTSLTDAMREIKYVPSRVGALGLFTTTSIDTLDVAIEKDSDRTFIIVPASPRGSPGKTWGKGRRSMRKLSVPHFQVDDAIYADEVQAVRAFGETVAVETLQGKIAGRAAEASQSFALTEEFHRLAILKAGTLLDSDGSVLFDYYTEFGEEQPVEIDFDLDNTAAPDGTLLDQCASLWEAMAETLDGLPFTGIRALAGSGFYKALRKHKEVRETYKYQEGRALREGFVKPQDGLLSRFEFGDITWEWYRGGLNVGVASDSVHFIPEGVPGLFRTVFAPADYIETVNRPGQRLYAKQWPMENGKGVNLEFQSNVLHYCTRPRVLMRGKRT